MVYALFPALYTIANSKDAWVAEVWEVGGVGHWSPWFSEISKIGRMIWLKLFSCRSKTQWFKESVNKLVWKLNKGGNISVKSYHTSLEILCLSKKFRVLRLLQRWLSLFGRWFGEKKLWHYINEGGEEGL